tara:strand:+ start:503 stop:844 length:342 start_codon:yes stop_codon:yes gene_type:complete
MQFTERQMEYITKINELRTQYGRPPTGAEIARAMNANRQSVYQMLYHLRDLGYDPTRDGDFVEVDAVEWLDNIALHYPGANMYRQASTELKRLRNYVIEIQNSFPHAPGPYDV